MATQKVDPTLDPNPPTKPASEVDRLRAENEKLRNQLAAAGRGAVTQPQHVFQLSEGERQELEIYGVVNKGGRAMTKDDVEQAMAAAGQHGVEIADAPEETKIQAGPDVAVRGDGIRGIDYVYPSVKAGEIDPKVAGTPGISGPAADEN